VARLALAVGGGAVGAAVGGPLGARIGFLAGSALGGILFPADGPPDQVNEGPRISDTRVQTSAYGQYLPVVYGRVRLSGNIIWASNVREVIQESSQDVGGKGGSGSTVTSRTYLYYRSFAVGLCLGPALAIHKIWANTELIYDLATGASAYDNVRYLGTETQLPDSIIESFGFGTGFTPAYRGLVYVVFDDMLISNFSNAIPSLNFEVEV
jgi:hypothetical protein